MLFGLVVSAVLLASGNARSGTDKNVTISLELNREDHIIGEFVPPVATLVIRNNGKKALGGCVRSATRVESGSRKSLAVADVRQQLTLMVAREVAPGKEEKISINLSSLYKAYMRTECKLHVEFRFERAKAKLSSPVKTLDIVRLQPTHSQVATYVFKAAGTQDSYTEQFGFLAAKLKNATQVFYKDANGLRRMGKAHEKCALQLGVATDAEKADKKEVRLLWRTAKNTYRYLRIPGGLLNSRETPGRPAVYPYYEAKITSKTAEPPVLSEKGKLHLVGKMTKAEAVQRSDNETETSLEDSQAKKKKPSSTEKTKK